MTLNPALKETAKKKSTVEYPNGHFTHMVSVLSTAYTVINRRGELNSDIYCLSQNGSTFTFEIKAQGEVVVRCIAPSLTILANLIIQEIHRLNSVKGDRLNHFTKFN
jgi:hypothetical protein